MRRGRLAGGERLAQSLLDLRRQRRLDHDAAVRLDAPADTLGAVLPVLARLGAVPGAPVPRGRSYLVEGDVPAAQVHQLQQRLSALTRGESVLETAFDRYQPVRGPFPTRPRTDHNPLDRKAYLRQVLRRA